MGAAERKINYNRFSFLKGLRLDRSMGGFRLEFYPVTRPPGERTCWVHQVPPPGPSSWRRPSSIRSGQRVCRLRSRLA
jgi:hypothetical protein